MAESKKSKRLRAKRLARVKFLVSIREARKALRDLGIKENQNGNKGI